MQPLQTTLLCCNRVFNEKGISRHIAGYHKDLIGKDVTKRLTSPLWEIFQSNNQERKIETMQEVLGYMKLYAKNEEIYKRTLGLCRFYISEMRMLCRV